MMQAVQDRFTILREQIEELSEADDFKKAKTEWVIDTNIAAPEEPCICGNSNVIIRHHLKNVLNGQTVTVGDSCVNKFRTTDDINAVIQSLENIQNDDMKSLTPEAVNYIYPLGWINNYEFDFLTNIAYKPFTNLTEKQQQWRLQLNSRLIHMFEQNPDLDD